MISHDNLVSAVMEFVRDDIIPQLREPSTKMIVKAFVKFGQSSPKLVDKLLSNSMVSAILDEQNGMFDTDKAMCVIKDVVAEEGKICIYIPAIPLIAPKETKLGLTVSDIEKLENRISQYRAG